MSLAKLIILVQTAFTTFTTWPNPQATKMINAAITLNKGSKSFVMNTPSPNKSH